MDNGVFQFARNISEYDEGTSLLEEASLYIYGIYIDIESINSNWNVVLVLHLVVVVVDQIVFIFMKSGSSFLSCLDGFLLCPFFIFMLLSISIYRFNYLNSSCAFYLSNLNQLESNEVQQQLLLK